jgi:hypothetical protein
MIDDVLILNGTISDETAMQIYKGQYNFMYDSGTFRTSNLTGGIGYNRYNATQNISINYGTSMTISFNSSSSWVNSISLSNGLSTKNGTKPISQEQGNLRYSFSNPGGNISYPILFTSKLNYYNVSEGTPSTTTTTTTTSTTTTTTSTTTTTTTLIYNVTQTAVPQILNMLKWWDD